MRLYKPTIYRLAASEVIRAGYCCPAIGRACVILLSKGKGLSEEERGALYWKRTPIIDELAEYFRPNNKSFDESWFSPHNPIDTNDIRILALLLMAEITKGQYINIELPKA